MEKQMMFLQVSGCYLFYKPASMRQCEDFSKDAGRFGLKSNAAVPNLQIDAHTAMDAPQAEK